MKTSTRSRLQLLVVAGCGIGLLTLSACSSRNTAGDGSATQEETFEVRSTDTVYAYRSNSPYRNVLKDCTLINNVADSCTLTTLPFTGDGITSPTIDDVMDRVLVTHDWMGRRFESFLNQAPPDLINMFASVTSILIGSDVRPSNYRTTTGGIQLDPDFLWVSVDEKGSISTEEDYRSGFGDELGFRFYSSTRNSDGTRLVPSSSLLDAEPRPEEFTKLRLFDLLYHELTHAVDFMPGSKIAGLDTGLPVIDAIESVRPDWLSNRLQAAMPLTSLELEEFAQVRYRGETPTDVQKAVTPTGAGALMAADGAIKFYSYTSQYEDIAQLVTAVMMSYHFGGNTNAGFTNQPADLENFGCSELLVGWGQRNRLADPLVEPRARLATEYAIGLTPELEQFLDTNRDAEAMDIGINWCDNHAMTNVVISADPMSRSVAPREPTSGPEFMRSLEQESDERLDGVYHY